MLVHNNERGAWKQSQQTVAGAICNSVAPEDYTQQVYI